MWLLEKRHMASQPGHDFLECDGLPPFCDFLPLPDVRAMCQIDE